MYEFTSEGWLYLNGRGVVFYVPADEFKATGLWEPNDLRGMVVKIDGNEVTVKGVDAYAMMRSPTSPYPHGIGICV